MTNKIIGGVAVVALVLAFLAYTKPGQVVVREIQQLGNASSPSVIDGCMEFGGVTSCNRASGLTLASTTCSVKAPTATSTLRFASFVVSSTSATAALVEFGKATDPFSTTTFIGGVTIAANAKATVIASTSPSGAGLNPTIVFGPNTYLNWKVGSGVFQYGGNCKAEFTIN